MREITYCLNCGGKTGYGFGVEPKRYDTVCCSSKCLKVLEKDFFRYSNKEQRK